MPFVDCWPPATSYLAYVEECEDHSASFAAPLDSEERAKQIMLSGKMSNEIGTHENNSTGQNYHTWSIDWSACGSERT